MMQLLIKIAIILVALGWVHFPAAAALLRHCPLFLHGSSPCLVAVRCCRAGGASAVDAQAENGGATSRDENCTMCECADLQVPPLYLHRRCTLAGVSGCSTLQAHRHAWADERRIRRNCPCSEVFTTPKSIDSESPLMPLNPAHLPCA